MTRTRRRGPLTLLAVALALSGCTGGLDESAAGPRSHAHVFSDSPGIRLLSPTEYANAVESLVGVGVDANDAPRYEVVLGHGGISGAQSVALDGVEAYYDLGASVAQESVEGVLTQRACDDGDAPCITRWTTEFLRRAFRREPSADLVTRFVDLQANDQAGASSRERMVTMITTVLNSPLFLYRDESGIGEPVGGERLLDPHQIAARLSFLLWQAEPDQALLDDANAGRLSDPDARSAQLTRMLADPRSERGLTAFVFDWMGLFENHIAAKLPAILEGTPPEFPSLAEESFRRTIAAAIQEDVELADLLALDHFVVDSSVATVVGVTAPAAGVFESRSIAGTGRLGILTHPLVISAHSKESGASPFPIGRFIYENILCEEIPNPPAVFPLPPVDDPSATFRQRLETVTANQPCSNCHRRIGPTGFAFLPFDVIGRYSEHDTLGRPFETAGEIELDHVPFAFSGIEEMSAGFAENGSVRSCVARRLFRWTFGRFEAPGDQALIEELDSVARTRGTAPQTLLDALVRSDSFIRVRTR